MSSIRMLRTFLAVAAEGSFTAAAQRVALTQAAVGLQMRSLEEDLKRTLFTRRGKLVTLNDQGRALVPVATQIVALYEQARHGAQADAPLAGTVWVVDLWKRSRVRRRWTLLERTLSAEPGIEAIEVTQASSR